ncbi:hypothetical protein GX50_00388 [[Emmonsia] crescens]|uniref:Uncharacterized protein n=1 Tax=[Emmonsia] crescens TaxID=73230 RepID=A0A2B7ZU43_9EURO|nr:hypothetical protein GX50_00388 [Emmonsia crescens]
MLTPDALALTSNIRQESEHFQIFSIWSYRYAAYCISDLNIPELARIYQACEIDKSEQTSSQIINQENVQFNALYARLPFEIKLTISEYLTGRKLDRTETVNNIQSYWRNRLFAECGQHVLFDAHEIYSTDSASSHSHSLD